MQGNHAAKTLSYRWVIFSVMALAYVFVYFHRQSPAVVANDLQETFNTSAGLVGLLASAYFYPYALMQFPAGLLSDSLGPRKSATIFLLLAAGGSILFGLAPTVGVAVLARVLVGLGVSLVFIPTMKVLSQWFRAREFSSMVAALNVTGGVGVLIAATPLALVTGWIGWRSTFMAIGLATIVIVILVWTLVRNRPEDMDLPSLAQIDHVGEGLAAPPQQIPLWEGAKRVVSEPRFWAVACWFFCICGVFFGFAGLWAGPYLMHAYGMSRAQAGGVLNLVAVGLIVGSPLMSLLSEKVFMSRKKVMWLAGSLLIAELIFLNIYPSGLPLWSLYPLMFLFSVFSSAIVIIGFTTTKELFPVEIAGTSVGTVNLFPFLGGAIMQVLLGLILDQYPRNAAGNYPVEAYSGLLLVMLLTSCVGFAAIFFMKETFPDSE